jgi:hypothetical protein
VRSHSGAVRGFHIYSEAWYRINQAGRVDEIMVGMYHPEGGTSGEFAIEWTMLAGKPTPCLKAFGDSWSALLQFQDLLAWLATVDGQNPSPRLVSQKLRDLGVSDLTNRTRGPAGPADREYASWLENLRSKP